MTEALNVAQSDPDPSLWPAAELGFNHELGWKHDHEHLRMRLSDLVAAEPSAVAVDLHAQAAEVAVARDQLETADSHLEEKRREHRRLHTLVSSNDHDLGRFNRMKNRKTKWVKYTIATILVLTEAALTGEVSAVLQRNVHVEGQEDRGFRVLAVVLLGALLLAIVPLSFLRAEHAGDGAWEFVLLYFCVQVGISGYFFRREWNDLSNVTESLRTVEEVLDETEQRRGEAYDAYVVALGDYLATGEEALRLAKQAPSYDRQIVTSFEGLLEHFRAQISIARPELAPFLFHAPRPKLDETVATSDAEPHERSSEAEEALLLSSLDELIGEDARRRPGPAEPSSWKDELAPSVAEGAPPFDRSPDGGWVTSKAPLQLLAYVLDLCGGYPLRYTPPVPAASEPRSQDLLASGVADGTPSPEEGDGRRDTTSDEAVPETAEQADRTSV